MEWLKDMLMGAPVSGHQKVEAEKLLEELIRIGANDDYLSERPGGNFNVQCRHVRAIAIGKRLWEIGGLDLMNWAFRKVRRKLKRQIASHLEYAWDRIGDWRA